MGWWRTQPVVSKTGAVLGIGFVLALIVFGLNAFRNVIQ